MDDGGVPALRYGVHGRLEHDTAADTLLCRVCGGWYRNLAQHARRAHGLPADEYRALAGLNRQTRLVARVRSEGKLRTWGEDPEKLRRDKAGAVQALRRGLRAEGRQSRRGAFTQERRRELSERRRARNLAGEDRASGEAIARAAGRCGGSPPLRPAAGEEGGGGGAPSCRPARAGPGPRCGVRALRGYLPRPVPPGPLLPGVPAHAGAGVRARLEAGAAVRLTWLEGLGRTGRMRNPRGAYSAPNRYLGRASSGESYPEGCRGHLD